MTGDDLHRFICQFTSASPIAVTFTMDSTPYTGRTRDVRKVVEYRDRTSRRRSDDGYIGPVGGFLIGSML